MSLEQHSSIEGEDFILTKEIILDNKEQVTNFFGGNRTWYDKLKRGGTTFGRTSLDFQEDFASDNNELDFPPLDPKRISKERATSIEKFFVEYPAALAAFLEYSKWYTEGE